MFRSTSGDLHISQSAYRLATLGFKWIIRYPIEGCIIHGKIHAAFIPLVSFLSRKSHTTRYPERDRLDPFTSARTDSRTPGRDRLNPFKNTRTGSRASERDRLNPFTSTRTGSRAPARDQLDPFMSPKTGSRAPERDRLDPYTNDGQLQGSLKLDWMLIMIHFFLDIRTEICTKIYLCIQMTQLVRWYSRVVTDACMSNACI